MRRSLLLAAGFLAACVSLSGSLRAQVTPSPQASESPSPVPAVSASPAPGASAAPTAAPSELPGQSPSPSPTPPPIVVTPASALVGVGAQLQLHVTALGPITATVANPALLDAGVDQASLTVTLAAKAPGTTTVTITDGRGQTFAVPVRTAYFAGTVSDNANVRITGDPARPEYVREAAIEAARAVTSARPGAQIVTSIDDLAWYKKPLIQDDVVSFNVPVLVQGTGYFDVQGTTHVRVENMAAPKIMPRSLLVSDYPERLEENGVLFTSDLQRDVPSRFLYFHYNPPGAPDRRIVLRAENSSSEPAVLQFISGPGGPTPNEMEVGHEATRNFIVHLTQNEGRIVVVPAHTSANLVEQPMPAKNIVCNILQLRVLNGAPVHLTLFAQNATDSPSMELANVALLEGGHPHARGNYSIPEFHYSRLWNVEDPYLELPIGQFPLQNNLKGEALAGDYGVLQSFVIKIENSGNRPQPVAIYENPRGGRATGTFLIDGVLIQSHGVPAFSRYKVRQYVVPARGFVRVTIQTIPEGGSSYPVRLIFAPDDGSIAPGAPGSPVY